MVSFENYLIGKNYKKGLVIEELRQDSRGPWAQYVYRYTTRVDLSI